MLRADVWFCAPFVLGREGKVKQKTKDEEKEHEKVQLKEHEIMQYLKRCVNVSMVLLACGRTKASRSCWSRTEEDERTNNFIG